MKMDCETLLLIITVSFVSGQEHDCELDPEVRNLVKKRDLERLGETLINMDRDYYIGDVELDQHDKIDKCMKSSPAINNNLMRFVSNGKSEPDSYKLLRKLVSVYEGYENIEEKEKAINELINRVLDSNIMTVTVDFLNQNGLSVTKSKFKECLKRLWFTPYSRFNGVSSGFQHVFMADLKKKAYSGLHNWIYYLDQQQKNNVIYKGSMKSDIIKNHLKVIRVCLEWKGHIKKKGSSMFVSSSPELEFALYSICFLYRPGNLCNVNRSPLIQILTYQFNSTNILASAFPIVN